MKTKMKTTLLFYLFPLLLFLVTHADAQDLKCSNKTEAELGKDVTLYCYCEPRCDVTGEVLKWKFNQKTTVLAYREDYNLEHQDPQFNNVNQQADQFKGRARVSSTERLKDGNFPVTISKVRKRDEGTYTCHVGNKTCSVERKTCSVENKTCRVELKVKKEDKQASGAQEDNIPPPSDGPDTGAIIGIVAVALVAAAIGALVTWLICSNDRTQREGEQDERRPSREGIELPSTTQNQERSPSEADPLTAPS